MNSPYGLLAQYIRHTQKTGGLVFYRGDDELEFLKNWLKKKTAELPAEDNEIASRDNIALLIKNCKKCEDIQGYKIGIGSGDNGIMVILNNPSLVTKKEKELLRSDAVELLKKMINAIKIDFDSCYITNLIKCDTPGYINRPSEMFGNCEGILREEIKLLRPRIVLVMGEMMPLRNIINDNEDISWYNLDHPLVLIKNPELKRPAWSTLQMVMARIGEGH